MTQSDRVAALYRHGVGGRSGGAGGGGAGGAIAGAAGGVGGRDGDGGDCGGAGVKPVAGGCQIERLAAQAFCLASAREGRATGLGGRSARGVFGKRANAGARALRGGGMTVHFIGAGPGAADLLTLRGRDLIAASPVCLYAGSLVPEGVLAHCPPGCRIVNTAPLSLDEIMAEIAAAHAAGQDVARLHSGDLSVWSAMGEQLRRLRDLGIPYDVTPGVPSFAAAAAALGVELTLPGLAQSVVLTRVEGRATQMPERETLAAFARDGGDAGAAPVGASDRQAGGRAVPALRRGLPGGGGLAGQLAGSAGHPGDTGHAAGRGAGGSGADGADPCRPGAGAGGV